MALISFCVFLDVLQVDDELEIKAYYAGHVLGAAMFHMRVGTESLVYTVSILTKWMKLKFFYNYTFCYSLAESLISFMRIVRPIAQNYFCLHQTSFIEGN